MVSRIRPVHSPPASVWLSWLHSKMHQSLLMLGPLQIPSTMVLSHIWMRGWHHQLLGQAMPLWCYQIRWCTPVWCHTIVALVICLGKHSYHLRAHIDLWTCAQSQETLRALFLILLGDLSSMLHCFPSKQCYINMLAQCRYPYKEYGQL